MNNTDFVNKDKKLMLQTALKVLALILTRAKTDNLNNSNDITHSSSIPTLLINLLRYKYTNLYFSSD